MKSVITHYTGLPSLVSRSILATNTLMYRRRTNNRQSQKVIFQDLFDQDQYCTQFPHVIQKDYINRRC